MFQWKLQFCLLMIIGLQSGKNALIEFVVVFFFEKTLPSCAPDESLGVQWSQALMIWTFCNTIQTGTTFFQTFFFPRWIHDQKEFVTVPILPSFRIDLPKLSICEVMLLPCAARFDAVYASLFLRWGVDQRGKKSIKESSGRPQQQPGFNHFWSHTNQEVARNGTDFTRWPFNAQWPDIFKCRIFRNFQNRTYVHFEGCTGKRATPFQRLSPKKMAKADLFEAWRILNQKRYGPKDHWTLKGLDILRTLPLRHTGFSTLPLEGPSDP